MDLQPFYRDTWVEVHLDAIRHNIQQLKQVLPDHTKIFAVVKGNAYGHGDIQVANVALEEGVYGLSVTLLDEALRLRRAGIKAPILVMSWTRPQDVEVAIKNNITLTVFQRDWIEQAKNFIGTKALSVHVKLDTGMGRVGVRTDDELVQLMEGLQGDRFHVAGAFTHFATADEEELSYYEKQRSRFIERIELFRSFIQHPVVIHSGNSAASMRFPGDVFDGVRYGVSLYGLYPSSYLKQIKPIDLQPAFSLHSRLIHVKQMPKGEGISYGRTYETNENEWVGTVPIGYADGWIRRLNSRYVLIGGKQMPIIGRICMDQFMVRLDKEYAVGEKVTLIGKQKNEEITADDVAETLETINYEVPCSISYRVPRVYVSQNEVIYIENKVI
ncbi:alanine racemase [Salinibacillus xinjiangensis]|uniref:Alanine racemase n=1 Tax=Salinibacillus xinjiangensis TaxID=1229268 RepID=A0A6G1X8L9_9BACI|nr:alanine racemase [Salinibacillus xinjiangensis]MRG87220.1 alanine racemase [Salinibacillus xinjiangensis]